MFSAIIVAAGNAKRTGLGYNKIFYKIKNKTLIEHSVNHFLMDDDFEEVIIVVSKEDLQDVRKLFSNTKIKYVIGGSTRQKSVFNGLALASKKYVFIHDSARPNLDINDLSKLKEEILQNDCVVLYAPIKDSVVEYSGDIIKKYLNRDNIALIQTPQVFNSDKIKKAHSLALKNKHNYTDDVSLYMDELKAGAKMLQGNELNIKATTKSDLALLEDML